MVFHLNNFYVIKNEYGFINKIDFSSLRFFTIPQLNKWFVSRTSFMLEVIIFYSVIAKLFKLMTYSHIN